MFMRLLESFIRNDVGATAIEYALLCSLIAVVLIVALGNLGTGLSSEFSEVSGAILYPGIIFDFLKVWKRWESKVSRAALCVV